MQLNGGKMFNTANEKINKTIKKQETLFKIHILINPFFIDFNILASKYPKLYPYLVILGYRTVINFKDQTSLIVLAEAIMKCIFGIDWSCPPKNLCPRIPNRLNYLLWVYQFVPCEIKSIIDIGTGASLIYPLLGWSVFKWKSLAIDSNEESIEHAKQLVSKNGLENVIRVIKVDQDRQMFNLQINLSENDSLVDVSICNPPFYDNCIEKGQENDQSQQFSEKKQKDQKQKEQINFKFQYNSPLGTMLKEQFSVQGGQYQFFFAIYRQSFKHVYQNKPVSVQNCSFNNKNSLKIKYFTCMIGRQINFLNIKAFLQYEMSYGVLQTYKLGQIRQGSNTRFIVMWRPESFKIENNL